MNVNSKIPGLGTNAFQHNTYTLPRVELTSLSTTASNLSQSPAPSELPCHYMS